jgi:YtkA-like
MDSIRGHFNRGRRVAASAFCKVLVAVACVVMLAATGCHRPSDSAQGISIQQEITPQPARVGEAMMTVELADAAANPVTNAAIMAEAEMNHPGMAPAFNAANETAPGRYRAQINFTMGGDWVVLLHIKLADGRKIERQVDVKGVRSN